MGTPSNRKAYWGRKWSVGVRVWIERDAKAVLGEGRAELLEAIGQHRSITASAKAAGMSYRRAWTLIQEINEAAGGPLVKAAVGGIAGGGAVLTERGKSALRIYRELEKGLHERAAGVLDQSLRAASESTPCIHLAAAISLQELIGQILSQYALQRPTISVRAVYGASNELADHVLDGAPVDLFIAAEGSILNRLANADRILPRSRRAVATNELAIVGRSGMKGVRNTADLTGEKVRTIVLADPDCPLGIYSRQYLQDAGIYESLASKIIYVDNSRAVLSAVAANSADIGVAFASDASRSSECRTLIEIPAETISAKYEAAIVRGGGRQKETRDLLEFITSPKRAALYARCGMRQVQ